MKNYFALALICCGITAQAQITITQTDMPTVGDTIRVSFAANTNIVDPTITGANALWDYSAFVPNAQQVIQFSTPTALPFNFTSNYGTLNPSPDTLPFVGDVPTNFIDYFKVSSSSFRQVGSSFDYAPIGSFSIPLIYSASDYRYRFPLQYGNVDSCDAAYALTLPGLGYLGQDRHRVNVVDGWGTLITPFGTFQTVRVKSIVDATDSIALDTIGVGFSIPRAQVIEYKWLAAGMDIPVLQVDAQMLFNAEVISSVKYQDSVRDSVFQVGIQESIEPLRNARIYPNPAAQSTTIQYTLTYPVPVMIRVFDITGREVLFADLEKQGIGTHTYQLNVSTLSSGVYCLQITSGTQVENQLLSISGK